MISRPPPSDSTRSVFDAGRPFVATAPDGNLVVVDVAVCARSGCDAVHAALLSVPAQSPTGSAETVDTSTGTLWPPFQLRLDGDPALEPEGPDGQALLAAHPWLRAWVEGRAEELRGRVQQLRMQRAWSVHAQPLPPWSPGRLVSYCALFPFAFDPVLLHEGTAWYLLDRYCPDPACEGDEADIELHSPLGVERIRVHLRARRAASASPRGTMLWAAIGRDRALSRQLLRRRSTVRSLGPAIVTAAYEAVRARHRPAWPRETAGLRPDGYLAGGASPEAVGTLFGALGRFEAAWDALSAIEGLELRVSATGELSGSAVERRGRVELGLDAGSRVILRDDGDAGVERLVVELATRADLSADARLDRLEHGWSLVASEYVPALTAFDAAGAPVVPTALDVALATGLLELVAEAARTTVDAPEPPPTSRTLSRTVELAGGAIEVRLELHDDDAAHAGVAPAGSEHHRADDLGEHDDDHDLDDDDDGLDPTGLFAACDAFEDFALERGHSLGVARAVFGQLEAAGVRDASSTPWATPSELGSYLARASSRARDAGGSEPIRAALGALADWLEVTGHDEDGRYRDVVERFLRAPPRVAVAASAPTGDRTRWQPAPGEAVPAPTDPCPCGSGRRYKKCCKRR